MRTVFFSAWRWFHAVSSPSWVTYRWNEKANGKKIERLHSTDYDEWAHEILPSSAAWCWLCFSARCRMEQGVKLLNNRNLYHLDDFESIISYPCCAVSWSERCWFILCVVFECERLFTTEMNFVFTSLSSSPWLWFLCSFFTRYKNKLFACEWKWQSLFFLICLKRRTFPLLPTQKSRRLARGEKTFTRNSSWRRRKKKQSKFLSIHWAIIY